MYLQKNEQLVKTYYHHPLPLILRVMSFIIVSLPFYFVASFFQSLLTVPQMALVYSAIAGIFGLLIIHDVVLYYMDRLVITNIRILHIDWKSLFTRLEHEAELVDIQDIATEEGGILAALPIFDVGTFSLETASTKTTIVFKNAPDPEGIKHFIYHLNVKPHRIGTPGYNTIDDKARYSVDEEARVSRRQ